MLSRVSAGVIITLGSEMHRITGTAPGAGTEEEEAVEKYCIYFINPRNGKRVDYMHNLPREEAEQRVYGLRFLKMSPLIEKQEREDRAAALPGFARQADKLITFFRN